MKHWRVAGDYGHWLLERLKPLDSTVTVYSPIGTARKRNSPLELLCIVCEKSEERECNRILAPAMAWCCGSKTTPRTSPKDDARDWVMHERTKTAHRSMRRTRGWPMVAP